MAEGPAGSGSIGPLVGELFNHHPLASSATHYGRIVRGLADRRRIILRLSDGLRYAYDGSDDVGALVAEITAGLESIGDGQQADRFPRMTCAELDSAVLEIRYLVDGLLVAG